MMKTIFIFTLLVIGYSVQAQHVIKNTFQSPDVSSLISEVQTPVSLSSGSLGIEIPLYTLKQGDITVPITLGYDATGVRVASHPGWTGQNWTLKAGGMISRITKSIPDETFVSNDIYLAEYGGDNYQTFNHYWGYFYNRGKLGAANWNTTSQISAWAKPSDSFSELEADEFIFNFCGQTGKFYMDRDGALKVVGDKGYKVDYFVLTNIPLYDGRKPLHYRENGVTYINDDAYTYQDGSDKRYYYLREARIAGFKITDPQGFVYYFGCYEKAVNGQINVYKDNFDGIEITSSFFSQLYNENYSTWYLVKIVSPNKNQVLFNYGDDDSMVATFSTSYTMNNTKIKDDASFWNLWSPSYLKTTSEGASMDGSLIRTQYLKSITTDNMTIEFSRSDVNALDYNYFDVQDYLDQIARESYDPQVQSLYFYGIWPVADPKVLINYNNQKVIGKNIIRGSLVWEKLDEITIKWKNSTQQPLKYKFTYRESPTERLQLTSIQKLAGNIKEKPYIFTYNNAKKLPPFLDIRTDHWGYYNGTTPSVSDKAAYINYKAPNPAYTDSEILKKITYPTGGTKEFVYEPNKYTKVVKRDKSKGTLSVVSVGETVGGGLRIKEIIERPDPNTVAHRVTYTYSGGILNGEVQYYWPNYTGLSNSGTYTATRFFSYSILPVSENSAGGVVSYSKVTESTPGLGKTEYTYTNHDTHPDENSVSIDPQKSAYTPLTNRSAERGQLLSETVYKEGSQQPLKKTTYTYYSPDSDEYIRSVQVKNYTLAGNMYAYEGAAYKIYMSPVLLLSQKEEMYTDGSTVPVVTESTYTYNDQNLVTQEETTGSKYSSIIKYKTVSSYAVDYLKGRGAGNSVYIRMVDSCHILTPLIEQTLTVNGRQVNHTFNNYAWDANNIPYLSSVSVSHGDYPSKTVFQCVKLDSKGNPYEIVENESLHTVYIWGYNHQYLLAEIKNATYSQVETALTASVLHAQESALTPDMNAINALRTTLPQALITTYTYIPLVGIRTVTNPDGIKTTYEYDALGRLTAVRDHRGSFVKSYIYHYANE